MEPKEPTYEYPVEWINHTEGAARPAGIYLLDGMVRLAARHSAAEANLLRAGALYVALRNASALAVVDRFRRTELGRISLPGPARTVRVPGHVYPEFYLLDEDGKGRWFPCQVSGTRDFGDVLTSPEIDAVAVITPVSTHFELAKKALENGKHVFVEKPFTATAAQAEELINLAEQKKLTIMVDHTFIFTGAVRKIKELVDKKVLGDLYYYDSVRVNLGLFQRDVNVIWDLAPHDFAVMDYLIDEKPAAVAASGKAHVNGMEDTAYVTVHFSNNMIAHFNVNWLSPVKVRTTLIGGEKKMLVWNDLEPDEKIKIYDKFPEVTRKLIADLQPQVPGVELVEVKSFEELVRGSLVVVTGTAILARPDPQIRDEWVEPGAFLAPVDFDSLWEWKTFSRADKFLVDSLDEMKYFMTVGYLANSLPPLHGEIGEVVAGIKPGRERDDELGNAGGSQLRSLTVPLGCPAKACCLHRVGTRPQLTDFK